ncbi:MAG: carbohydrate ABC transporter permease [Candidatus Nanopelagicales bacterium]|nr:carbohydrate ABC transporter permease [Candidatus Nanopelagicales bacterium]
MNGPGSRVRATVITAFTWLVVLLFFFPVFWMGLNAFKSETDAASSTPLLLFSPDLSSFQVVRDRGMMDYLLNSLLAAGGATLVILLFALPAAYALSIRPIKKVQDPLFFFLSTRFLPIAAVTLPLYMILKTIGFLDNIWALVLIYAAINLPIAVWMLRSFLMEIPLEIIEAAQIDGAGFVREFMRIVLPLILPGLAAAGLIVFIFSWNEYFLATLLTSNDARTTPPFLGSFVDGRGQFLAVLSTAALIAALPVIIAGWIAQKQLVRGLAMGAVK